MSKLSLKDQSAMICEALVKRAHVLSTATGVSCILCEMSRRWNLSVVSTINEKIDVRFIWILRYMILHDVL